MAGGGGFHPFDVNVPHLAYTFLGGFVVLFGMFSLVIKERLYIGEAVIATIFGIIIGPYASGLFNPEEWGGGGGHVAEEITLEVTRVVIALGVFAVGVELPKAYMKKHWKSLAFLLGPVMVFGWMISSLLIWAIFPKLSFLSSLVIAACVTPTDPILAQAVVGGKFADKHVPAHIRHLLSAESGCNDGAAFPFLYLALYLILDKSDAHAVGEWFYITWAYEVFLGIIIGSLLGFSARKTMRFCERKNLIDRQSYVAQYVSLAILSIGITTLLGSDDLLAAFACGTAFAWDGFFNKATEDALFSNVIDLLFNCACFIYIGAIIPFHSFANADLSLAVWRLVVLTIGILLIRRLPVILALYKWIPDIKTLREAAFVGWFGPMGVGAIFISTLARTKLPEPHDPPRDQVELLAATIGPITAWLVLCSVLFHGLSIPFFSLSRRVHSITYTWSRNPSMDPARGDEPAWTSHARRIQPGQQIRINRDDDMDEGGDIGLRPKATSPEDASTGSSSSRSRPGEGEEVEMQERRVAATDYAEDDRDEAQDGRRTPPLAEYREGNHLIIERQKSSGSEVDVEVIRNHFAPNKKPERTSFTHPHPLKHHEVDTLTQNLPKSIEHAASAVIDGGLDALDKMGLGMMHSNQSGTTASARASMESRRSGQVAPTSATVPENAVEDDDASSHRGSHLTPPLIRFTSRSTGSGSKSRLDSIKSKFFGKSKSRDSEEATPRDLEEGGEQDENMLSPHMPFPITRQRTSETEAAPIFNPERPPSPPRGGGIRFAEDTLASSDTAPGPGALGAPMGHKRTGSLTILRTSSIQSTSSGRGRVIE